MEDFTTFIFECGNWIKGHLESIVILTEELQLHRKNIVYLSLDRKLCFSIYLHGRTFALQFPVTVEKYNKLDLVLGY
jgi:hypothetical protein